MIQGRICAALWRPQVTARQWKIPLKLSSFQQAYWLSDSKKDSSATDQHQLFLEQMNELNAEQQQLFGSAASEYDVAIGQQQQQQRQQMRNEEPESDANNNDSSCVTSSNDDTRPTQEEEEAALEHLQQSRDLRYGFTEQDHDAWGDHRVQHRHDASFMEQVARKRQEYFERVDRTKTNSTFETSEIKKECSATRTMQPAMDQSTTPGLSHVSADGSTLHMVDVGSKAVTTRIATAETIVQFPPSVVAALQASKDNSLPKGPVFSTAITAGIMAAKQTSNLIPLCHSLFLSKVNVTIDWMECGTAVRVQCLCKIANAQTGVEMEALVGSTMAALTIYDMVKAVSHNVVLSQTRLLHKEGGKRHYDSREHNKAK